MIGNFLFANYTATIQPCEAFVLNLNHILFMENHYFVSVFYRMFLEYMKVSTFLTFNLKLWLFSNKKITQHFAQI